MCQETAHSPLWWQLTKMISVKLNWIEPFHNQTVMKSNVHSDNLQPDCMESKVGPVKWHRHVVMEPPDVGVPDQDDDTDCLTLHWLHTASSIICTNDTDRWYRAHVLLKVNDFLPRHCRDSCEDRGAWPAVGMTITDMILSFHKETIQLIVMISLSIHMMTSQDRMCARCVTNIYHKMLYALFYTS